MNESLSITANNNLLLCLPTPLMLVCGVSPVISLVVHQPAYLFQRGHSGDGCDNNHNLYSHK